MNNSGKFLKLCEPNYHLPQECDLEGIRESLQPLLKPNEQPKVEDEQEEDTETVYESDPDEDGLMPLRVHEQFDLDKVLSIRENEYLRCRWDKFLDDPPHGFVNLREHELQNKRPKPVKRMQLTGKFFDHNNKLAPIPYAPDPRQFWKKGRVCKDKHAKE